MVCKQLKKVNIIHSMHSLITLSKHQYGNYVVQSMMNKLSKDKRQYFKQVLKENV
jgi:preprotein translocase subunit Sec63